MTDVNGIVIAQRKEESAWVSVICTVWASTTLKPLISLALPAMKSSAPTMPV